MPGRLSEFSKFSCFSMLFVIVVLCDTPVHTQQRQAASYTRYELLSPESQSFRIIYDVSATTAGARIYFNTIRKGSEPTVHAVYDRMSGDQLEWQIVDGATALRNGHSRASVDGEYIQVMLARPVPNGGETRLRIDKTYKDPKSYFSEGGQITFSRSLGIKRNAIVLPLGYEFVGVNYPVQIMAEADGRLKASFMNRGPAAVPLEIKARKLAETSRSQSQPSTPQTTKDQQQTTSRAFPIGARLDYTFSERAFQNRDIVYFLQQPKTHSFRLYHDYTETREGLDRYVNVVRTGSKASNPSAKILDTGESLKIETLRGEEITRRGIEISSEITPESEVVVIWFDPVKKDQSVRLRIEETYTDPNRYLLVGDELIWDRSFGRPRNTVILPAGWYLTANAIPARISETADGKVRLDYVNDRPGNIDVFIKARRR